MTFHAGMVGTEKEFPHIIITLDFRKPTERERFQIGDTLMIVWKNVVSYSLN